MASNQVSVAVGAAMIVAGVGLWGVAASAQHQRAHSPLPPASATCPSCPACATCTACPSVASPPTGASSASPAMSASASAPAPAQPEQGTLFRFDPGKTSFQKEEIPRLIAHCRELLKQPHTKIQIEGIGEEEGPKGLAIGRGRGLITRMLLIDAGLDGERLVVGPPQAQASAESSGVRIRPMEVKNP